MWQMRRSRGPSLAEESSMEELTDTMKNFAMQFTGEVKSSLDLPFFEEIAGRGEELNYTIDSLRPIDPYLAKVHESVDQLSEQNISDLVLGIGSYLGETIINEGKKNYRWCPFQIYVQAFPEVRNILGEEPDINTFALCVRENGKMCMPLNKISRFLFEGPQHNLEFFVTEQLSDLR
jgi:hypothetical protein